MSRRVGPLRVFFLRARLDGGVFLLMMQARSGTELRRKGHIERTLAGWRTGKRAAEAVISTSTSRPTSSTASSTNTSTSNPALLPPPPHSLSKNSMYSTTGLAVGMAIGVPAFVFIVVFVVFWYRQKLKYKADIKQHNGIDDYDEVNDLDLDHMIDTPKESHIKDFSTDQLVADGDQRAATGDSGVDSTVTGNGVLIKNGSYSIRKESKIMGLRIVPKDKRHPGPAAPPRPIGTTSNSSSNIPTPLGDSHRESSTNSNPSGSRAYSDLRGQTPVDNDNNYKVYYESVIPVLPGSGLEQRVSGSFDGPDSRVNAPNTPMKSGNSLARNSNHSSADFYKMLQEDSPFYPRSRIPSSILGETPLRKSSVPNMASSADLAKTHRDQQQHQQQLFHSPSQSTTAEVSPFDTPPARTRVSERLQRENSTTCDHPTTSSAHDADHVKDTASNLFDHTMDSIDKSDADDASNNNSALESSPLRKNVHRRINSAESRMILDGNDAAEESYNMKRKEWLDMYRKK